MASIVYGAQAPSFFFMRGGTKIETGLLADHVNFILPFSRFKKKKGKSSLFICLMFILPMKSIALCDI